jgi:hypothetical protein
MGHHYTNFNPGYTFFVHPVVSSVKSHQSQGRPIERGGTSRVGFRSIKRELDLQVLKENVEMSSSSASHWLDRWWPLLVILYGVLFVSILVSFHPTT